jgi:hypothetical protein
MPESQIATAIFGQFQNAWTGMVETACFAGDFAGSSSILAGSRNVSGKLAVAFAGSIRIDGEGAISFDFASEIASTGLSSRLLEGATGAWEIAIGSETVVGR